jgi:hypothetical protein
MAQAGGLNKVLCWNTTKTALLNETAGWLLLSADLFGTAGLHQSLYLLARMDLPERCFPSGIGLYHGPSLQLPPGGLGYGSLLLHATDSDPCLRLFRSLPPLNSFCLRTFLEGMKNCLLCLGFEAAWDFSSLQSPALGCANLACCLSAAEVTGEGLLLE